ncbi:hypothetical protein HDE78_002993 [Rhodanobacter sp. K2T2]|uniref:hypothetical protein n=1 Tax=Rhodanobacter sp. K2T2 TaxID=2723085 RepID=UPI0015CE3912|nr:hypothetical protein [Rhodanobacter sp. K2T2]NYE30025.1 hypothetical protein [Rhodanobacter sp. K2T2]
MEMNHQAQFGSSAVPSVNQAAAALHLPDTRPLNISPLARQFVAIAQRLAAVEVSAGFMSLSEILKFAKLSNSSAYLYGLVPMYDASGHLKQNDKIPPHPWLQLPEPVIKTGKKRWATAAIGAWFDRMGIAANQNSSQSTILAGSHGEVTP